MHRTDSATRPDKPESSASNVDLVLTEEGHQQALDQISQAQTPQSGVTDPSVVDVRAVQPRHRHPMIFDTFEGLLPGQSFTLINDHDPKPLYYQFQAERTGQFTWAYLEQGPVVWRVSIGRALS